MAKRPTPHVDTSPNEAPAADFTPSFTPATDAVKHVKVCVYGDNGTGKTRFAGTFPKPIVLALDPGFTVLRQLPGAEDIHVVRVPDPNRVGVATLRQVWDYYQWLLKGEHDRQTVVLDSITELQKVILEAVMAKPRQRANPTVPETDDYVEVNAKLKTLIRYFRDLPMHVVFTGHHKILKKKDDIVGIRPDLSEKLSTELGGACDVVMHTTVHEKHDAEGGQTLVAYVGQTVPINGVQAKDRSDNLRTPYVALGFEHIAKAYDLPVAADNPAPTASKPKAAAKSEPEVAPEAAPADTLPVEA